MQAKNQHSFSNSSNGLGQENSGLLHRALTKGHFKSVQYLLSMKINPNVLDHQRYTPLMRCCVMRERPLIATRILRALLKAGADPNMCDSFGANALHLAVRFQQAHLVAVLLENNDLDLCAPDQAGLTVLHYLALGHSNMAGLIVKAVRRFHINIDVFNKEGLTPLHLACSVGNVEVARILVFKGYASLTMRDLLHHRTAQDWLEIHLGRALSVDENPFENNDHHILLPPLRASSIAHREYSSSSSSSSSSIRRGCDSAIFFDKNNKTNEKSWSDFLPRLYNLYSQQQCLAYRPSAIVAPEFNKYYEDSISLTESYHTSRRNSQTANRVSNMTSRSRQKSGRVTSARLDTISSTAIREDFPIGELGQSKGLWDRIRNNDKVLIASDLRASSQK